MRIKNTDKDFDRAIISLNNIVIHRGDILEASEEENKIWVIDNSSVGYRVVRGNVKITFKDRATANKLVAIQRRT